MQPDSHLPESAVKLKLARADLWERAGAGSVGGFAWEYTHLVDRYFRDRIREAGEQPFAYALVAVGGYGRGRLCPGSDVDILVLFRQRIPSGADAFIKALLFPLWDLGLDLGHGVRTIADCVSLARKDFQVLASLMDARPLAGDAEVFGLFRSTFAAKVLKKTGRTFADSLREHNLARGEQYGDATGMLEPELKNGLGGLRDGQQVVWLSRVLEAMGKDPVFLPEELSRLRDDQAFLNRVRTGLHLAAGRKNDRLFFDLQPPTARIMGFAPKEATPENTGLAVEFFLSRLHQAMTRIKAMREAMFQEGFPQKRTAPLPEPTIRNIVINETGIFFKRQHEVTADNALGAFLESARCGLPLTWGARRIIRSNPGRFAGSLIDRSETLSILVEIFMAPHCETACEGLLETRLLPAIFPEFGDVEHLIQFNDYHVHPVGRHTLAAVTQLSRFLNNGSDWTGEMAARIRDPRRLILAAFFHDLGKSEPSHSKAGAAIARDVLTRYGRSPETIDDVAFLVEHHLLMPKAATRRDLSDERVAADVAATISTLDRLDMLYLLSIADSMATGPRAWNNWTRSLLGELYFKVRKLLQYGPLAEPDAASRLIGAKAGVLAQAASEGQDPDFVNAALGAMPTRAFFALDTKAIAGHLRLVRKLWTAVAEDRMRKPSTIGGKGVNLIEAAPGKAEGTYELTFAAVDQPGLFATLAGALSLHGLNILAADIFTWKDGTVVDVFTVNQPPENLYLEEVWARVSRSVSYALTGKLDLAARLEERRNSPLTKGRSGPRLRPLVKIDNTASDFHTVIEVAATDRAGFLFDMARTLAAHSLSIHLAKITTIKGRAADVFHVRAQDGQRLLDEERIDALRRDLLEAARPA